MSDAPTHRLSGSSHIDLTYTRRTSRPHGGWFDLRGMAFVLTGAIVAAIAGLACFWIALLLANLTGIFFFVSSFAQGLVVGGLLFWTFRRGKVQHRSVIYCVSLAAGILSAALVYESLYVREAYLIQRRYVTGSAINSILALMTPGPRNPIGILDRVLVISTGHSGVIGYLIWRSEHSSALTAAISVHLVISVFVAIFISTRLAKPVLCPSCDGWMAGPKNIAVLPRSALHRLADVVRAKDCAGAAMLARELGNAPLGSSCSIARQFTCAPCGTRRVDVVLHASKSVVTVALPPEDVTEEFVNALRSEAALPVEAPAEASADATTESAPSNIESTFTS
jgi:hypothetical protein